MPPPARLLAPLLRVAKRPAAVGPHVDTISKSLRRPTTTPRRAASSSDLPQQFTQFSDAARSQRRRNFRRVLTGVICGGIGYYCAGDFLVYSDGFVYEPGSPEDVEELARLQEVFDDTDATEDLRSDKRFVESEPYGNLTPEEKEKRATSGALKGSRGISMQVCECNALYSETEFFAYVILP